MIIHNRTKIVCTIGPASGDKKTLRKMLKAGMDVARLNFSHGSYEDFSGIIKNLKEISKELNLPVCILQDLQGPKIRLGTLPNNEIILKKGDKIILSTKTQKATNKILPVMYKHLPKDVKRGDTILMKDGMIELKVIKSGKTDIQCQVETDGKITSHSGINVPTATIRAAVITAKDKKDLAFGIKNNVDYVALSFVKNAQDIKNLRKLIIAKKSHAKIVAKIERHEAVKNLEEIIKEADAVMVARGDLGVEIYPYMVPIIQKRIIHEANIHGKPVITATEMLQSMVTNPRATRAEVSDAANAIFDHSDALMLSNETAAGKYPVEAVRTLNNIANATEAELQKHEKFLPNELTEEQNSSSYAICANAARLSKNIGAKVIVAITSSGFTAKHIAKHRIYTPIIAITENPETEKQLQLVWGVRKTFIMKNKTPIKNTQIKQLLLKSHLAKKGDKIVIVKNAGNTDKTI